MIPVAVDSVCVWFWCHCLGPTFGKRDNSRRSIFVWMLMRSQIHNTRIYFNVDLRMVSSIGPVLLWTTSYGNLERTDRPRYQNRYDSDRAPTHSGAHIFFSFSLIPFFSRYSQKRFHYVNYEPELPARYLTSTNINFFQCAQISGQSYAKWSGESQKLPIIPFQLFFFSLLLFFRFSSATKYLWKWGRRKLQNIFTNSPM